MALVSLPQELRKRAKGLISGTAKWIINTQNSDGSWGYYGIPTLEETAYALQALITYYREAEHFQHEVLQRGASWLRENYSSEHFPPLWIGKCLYTPVNIVKSAIISALSLYYSTFARRTGDSRIV